ncbi:hypothetical protein JOF53_001301 [Crossiella equi]|uniref:Uncharacterized protein n=1 Tax=Crossiella equi TaxID=130796 RepID=A0ABS5A752_9PSEU|nr:hypothetical protein [Crossiella equi]
MLDGGQAVVYGAARTITGSPINISCGSTVA